QLVPAAAGASAELYHHPWRSACSFHGTDSGHCGFGGFRRRVEYLPPTEHCCDRGGSGGYCRAYRHDPQLERHHGVVWKLVEYHLYRDWHHDRKCENVVFKPLDPPAECLEWHL